MTSDDERWVPLTAPSTGQQIALTFLVVSPFLYATVWTASGIAEVLAPRWSLAWIALTFLFAAAIGFVVHQIVRFVNPTLLVNLHTREIKIRRKRVPFADVTRATVRMFGTGRRPSLGLALGTDSGLKGSVMLRDAGNRPLPEPARQLLLIVLRESTVSPPYASYDPKGRFAQHNFPGQLTKDDAIELVESNPEIGDPIPGVLPPM